MKKTLIFIFSIVLTLITTSCQWVSHKDKHELNTDIFNHMKYKPTAFVLSELGQPTCVSHDTIMEIPTTRLHFDNRKSLKAYANYDEAMQKEAPYIDIYMNEGKVYYTDSNLVKRGVSRNKYKISVFGLSLYAGLLALIITIYFCIHISKHIDEKRLIKYKLQHSNLNSEIEEKIRKEIEKIQKEVEKIQPKIEASLKKYIDKDFQEKLKLLRQGMEDKIDSRIEAKKSEMQFFLDSAKDMQVVNNFLEEVDFNTGNDSKEQTEDKTSPDVKISKKKRKLTPEQERFLLSPISESQLSHRIKNVMKEAEIITFLDLCKYTRKSISNFRNIGQNSLIQIQNIIRYNHLRFSTDYTKYLSKDLDSKEN